MGFERVKSQAGWKMLDTLETSFCFIKGQVLCFSRLR